MPFIVCDECGTKNELPSAAGPEGGAGNSYLYCRACANRIELRQEASAAVTSAVESSGSNDLLDELLSLPLAAPHHPAHAPEPEPPVANSSASEEATSVEAEVAGATESELAADGAPQAALSEGHNEVANAATAEASEASAQSTSEAAPEVLASTSTEPALAPNAPAEPAAAATSEVAAGAGTVVEAAAATVAAVVPDAVPAATTPPATAGAPVAVPRPSTTVETKPRRSQPPPLPATEVVAAPVAAVAPVVAPYRAPVAETPREIAVEAAPAPAASDINTGPGVSAISTPVSMRDSMEELSWELPSPMPPIVREPERATSKTTDNAALAPSSAVEPTLSTPTGNEQPLGEQVAAAQATSEQMAALPPAAMHAIDEPLAPVQAGAAQSLGEQLVPVQPATEQLEAVQPIVVRAVGEPMAAVQPIVVQAVGEPTGAPSAPGPSAQSTAGAFSAAEPVREAVSHVGAEAGSANIRATLPFGPTLPLRETIPGIVTDTDAEHDDLGASSAPIVVNSAPAPMAAAAATPAPTRDVSTESVVATAQPARIEPAPLPAAASAAIAQAAEATAPVLSRPFFAPSVRTTSDAPTTHSWPPPEASPSKLRRYAPLGAALGAVAVAFLGGIQVGKMSPNAPTPAAAAVTTPPAAPRPPVAEVAAPPTATAMPASAGTPAQTEPTALPGTKGSHTGLVALKPAANFNPKVANAALSQVNSRARACKKPGSVGGTAIAAVTFGPSGRVEDVTVSGARFAGTPIATCIASVLSTAKVPPFAGSAQTVKRAIKID
jgi:hypothetical protein